jgi:prolyl-tRNA synthetase
MRLCHSLVPTLLRAGLIRQTAAGIYAWLPLGWRVLQNIAAIVREEQNAAGAQELLMPTLQTADLWRESGRYDAYGPEMLRIRDRHERDLLYGPTNEEMITDILRGAVRSYCITFSGNSVMRCGRASASCAGVSFS